VAGFEFDFQANACPPGLFLYPSRCDQYCQEGEIEHLGFKQVDFTYPNTEVEQQVPADLRLRRFQADISRSSEDYSEPVFLYLPGHLTIGRSAVDTQFLVFQACLALNKGLPAVRNFPAFTEYWLRRPRRVIQLSFMPAGYAQHDRCLSPSRNAVIDEMKVESAIFPLKEVGFDGRGAVDSMFYLRPEHLQPMGMAPGCMIPNGLLIPWRIR